MKFALWLAASAVLNVSLFLWMRTLVRQDLPTPVKATPRAAVALVHLKAPPPKPPEDPEPVDPRPQMNAVAAQPSMPALSQPAMNLSAARAAQGLAAPVVQAPQMGPMSVKGRMFTGPMPGVAKGARGGHGNTIQGVGRAAPEPTLRIPPRYPPDALQEGIEGHVKVSFTIDQRGRPTKVQAQSATPEGVFEQAAIRAVRKWKYPKQTQPLPAVVTLEFKMQGQAQ